jgi:hypothetical protein
MSQNSVVLPTTGTVSGLTMTQNQNNANDTLLTLCSGTSAPTASGLGRADLKGVLWHDLTSTAPMLWMRNQADNAWIPLFAFDESNGVAAPSAPLAQCRLVLSGGNLKLFPCQGNRLTFPSGKVAFISSAGSGSLSNSGTAANSTYYIYAVLTLGVISLEASATGHSYDAASGIEIKTGDSTRVLVGMAQTTAGNAWADSNTQRFVINWFNRRRVGGSGASQVAQTWSNTGSLTEVNSAARVEFLVWGDDQVDIQFEGNLSHNNVGQTTTVQALTNSGAFGVGPAFITTVSGASIPVFWRRTVSLTEGYHWASMQGLVTAGTATMTYAVGISTPSY